MNRTKKPETQKLTSLKARKLLKAALKLFSEKDYNAVTIKDIAKTAKVNTALIYYYYSNKEELFRAAVEMALTNFLKYYDGIKERHTEPVDLINDWFDTHVQESNSIQRLVKIMLDYSSTHTQKKTIDNIIAQFYLQERELLVTCINKGIEQHIFKPVDPVRMSNFASTHLDGIITRSLIMKDLDIEQSVLELKSIFWSRLLL